MEFSVCILGPGTDPEEPVTGYFPPLQVACPPWLFVPSWKQLAQPPAAVPPGGDCLAGRACCVWARPPPLGPLPACRVPRDCVLGAMFDPFLGLLVTFSPGDPAWLDFPSAACCLEPASGLSRNRPLPTHSFPEGGGCRKRERLLSTTLWGWEKTPFLWLPVKFP